MVLVIGENNTRRCSWRRESYLLPLGMAMTVAIDISPSLSRGERQGIIGEPNDFTVLAVEFEDLLVEGTKTLVDIADYGEGDPRSRAGKGGEWVEVEASDCLYNVIDY